MKESSSDDFKDKTNNSSNLFVLKYDSEEESSAANRYSKFQNSIIGKPVKNPREQPLRKKPSYLRLCFKQTKLMLWKNYLVFKRSLKSTIFQIITPILICSLLLFLQILMNYYSSNVKNLNPDVVKLNNLERCTYPEDCTTIGYGLIVIILK
jgi:hypothetical protein